MALRKKDYTRHLFFAVTAWIFLFCYIGFRMLSNVNEKESRLNYLFRIAKEGFSPPIVDFDHPEQERKLVRDQEKLLKIIPQVVAPEDILPDFQNAGEMNVAVKIDPEKLPPAEKAKFDKGWNDNAFNDYANNLISLHRKLPDMRDAECRRIKYPPDLPTVSVIVIFHNEAWAALLRTVHSVIDRSSSRILKEIILVDDFSDKPHLKQPLEDYIRNLTVVRLIRAQKREGLIRARLMGASVATGEILIFLDSHCEATEGWLEPLIYPIYLNPNVSTVPVIETIDDNTFTVSSTAIENIQVGGFTWNLIFNWHVVPQREIKRRAKRTDPIRTPTMAGGLFAIGKKRFEVLGTYDSEMDIWGGENLELSFKVWMCGGELLTSPCSHVGHIFRKRSPYKWPSEGNVVVKNTLRLAMVWLDDFKPHFLDRIPKKYQTPAFYGDVSQRIKLKTDLKCQNFSWYHKEVYPELFIPSESIFSGEIRNNYSNYCVDAAAERSNIPIISYQCHGMEGNQYWLYTKENEIRRDDMCIDFSYTGESINKENKIITYPCHGSKGNQYWDYTSKGLLKHSSGFCMVLNDETKLVMEVCDENNPRHRWTWSRSTIPK